MKWTLFFSTAILVVGLLVVKISQSNVCQSFSDYYTNRDNNPRCYYNPDAQLTADEMITRHGYPVEIHNTTTKDGYILTVFRIPYGKNHSLSANINEQPRQPVFLLHGVALNSDSFTNIGKKSLAFILADAGYDVWLGNFRGTKYSRKHVSLETTDQQFWNYTFHEMGIYDVPAQVDLVSDYTNQKIIYIGYSLGSTTAFIYGSTYPEISEEKVKIVVCLAPATFMFGWKSITKYGFPLWRYLKPIIDWFNHGMLHLRAIPPLSFRSMLCSPLPIQMNICQAVDMLAWGFNYEQSDPETLPITILQNTEATSTKTLSHLFQLYHNGGKFDQFDYGIETNKQIYGTPEPPIYDLSRFRVPVHITRAKNDLMVTEEDIQRLNASLPEKVKPYNIYVVNHDGFNHGDFIQARDVVPLVYNNVLDVISRF